MAERPQLDAVLLDAGGTLIRLDFEIMTESLAELGAEIDAAALRRAEVEGRRCYDRCLEAAERKAGAPVTAGDARGYFGGMLAAAGVPEHIRTHALERWMLRQEQSGLWVRPMEEALAALEALAKLGLRCAVISNSDGRAEEHLRNCGFGQAVEFVVDSHLVGLEKPDPAIFRLALERMGVAPERALFVGDIRSVDEAGARAAGMHFVLLDPYGDYAAPEGAAIEGMGQLAAWVAERFQGPHRAAAESVPGQPRAIEETRS